MNTLMFRSRFHVTYHRMLSAVYAPQRTLPLRTPALWRRLIRAGWVMYRATHVARVRGIPGLAFDLAVASLVLVLGAANFVI